MDTDKLPYQVVPMTEDDLEAVMAIERMAFTLPWSARAYQYELHQNESAHLFVTRPRPDSSSASVPRTLWNCLRKMLGGSPIYGTPLVGYACLWMLVDEAHISTLAVHPAWRRRGIGSLLVYALLCHAQALEAQVVTLEVRVSNSAAQALYEAWGFRVVGRRRRYYSDTGEDALVMTTPTLTNPEFQACLKANRHALIERMQALPGQAQGPPPGT
jgi:ribosomal-protein-alanine N-acetyltransferase